MSRLPSSPLPHAGTLPLAPEHEQRIAEVEQLLALAGPGTWPGHLQIATAGRTRDVLLGNAGRTLPVAAIDWQSAPLAAAFFGCAEGGDYELAIDERAVEGRLVRRNLLGYDQGRLVEIETPEALLERRDGRWSARTRPPAQALLPRPEKLRRQQPWQIQLDPEQRRWVELPAGRSLLLLGEAGFGKTTVALHRLTALLRRGERRAPDPAQAAQGTFDFARRPGETARQLRAAVIVPTEGLRALTASLLERMGRPEVPVFRFEPWAAHQARRAFRGLPLRESVDASAAVLRFKRHPALRAAIGALVDRRRKKPRSMRRELEHLFGDSAVLEQAIAASGGALTAAMAREVLAHTRVQFSQTSAQQYAHVTDAQRLETSDGRGLDDGTPLEDAGSLDAEDHAVLFELDRLRAVRTGSPPVPPEPWDLLVVDEAQELAPLELALIGRSLAPGGTLVVAGDAAQQLDESAAFPGWPAAMAELGAAEHEAATLRVNYRCPPEVTAAARRLREGAARDAVPAGGPGIVFRRLRSELHVASWLCDELRALHESDPGASVAVIVRSPERARRLARTLDHALQVRLALGGAFTFRPGIEVTCLAEVRGLEFDHVILPDASAGTWPDTAESRRALYLAMTRACHQLVLASAGPFTPLLAPPEE